MTALHDPYLKATPSQRAAAAERSLRLAKIAGNAKPDAPIACLSASVRSAAIPNEPAPPMPFSDWLERQKRNNPLPKEPWFSIVDELTPPKIKILEIQRAVAKHYKRTVSDLVCSRRPAVIVIPRHVAIYLAKTLTPHSLPEIGRRFGGRDHTTALHAVRKIEAMIAKDEQFAAIVEQIKRTILGEDERCQTL